MTDPGPHRDNLAGIGSGYPDLHEYGPRMLVPFAAHRLRFAKVAWINNRWFRERGIDIADPTLHARICSWVLDEFAFVVPRPEDRPEDFDGSTRILHADGYGGTGLVPNGGSGRACVTGRFQAKGVGATPLVGREADWLHSHGCLWMEEAIRETIQAEICRAEFPWSAVPTVAILDTGLNAQMPPGQLGERRAILVRPTVLRPAHLQRAPMFRPRDSDERKAQLRDAARTRDAVRNYLKAVDAGRCAYIVAMQEFVTRVADQMAFGHAHRIGNGGYFSSNLALDGALLDFGNLCARADWRRQRDGLGGYREEAPMFEAAIGSVAFYCNKYKEDTRSALAPQALLESFRDRYRMRLNEEFGGIWIDSTLPDSLRFEAASVMSKFAEHQQKLVFAGSGASVLFEHQPSKDCPPLIERITSMLRGKLAELSPNATEDLDRATMRALRLLAPRPLMERDRLRHEITSRICDPRTTEPPDPKVVAAVIRECIIASRRHWPALPPHLDVVTQRADEDGDVLECFDHRTGTFRYWVEGPVTGNTRTDTPPGHLLQKPPSMTYRLAYNGRDFLPATDSVPMS